MVEIYQFDILRLWIVIIVTFVSYFWVLKIENVKIKLWYILVASFMLIYSGIGGAIKEVSVDYTKYYCIYTIILSMSLHFFYFKFNINRKENEIIVDFRVNDIVVDFIDRHGLKIIIFYFLLLLVDLVYPTVRLNLLINPPSPSLEGLHYNKFVTNDNGDMITQMVYLLEQFVVPFFFLSLYKYRENYKYILVLLLLPVYIDLCNRGIFGRGEAMIPLVIILLVLYEKISPKKRKILIVGVTFALPVFCYLFVQFSSLRIGGTFEQISFTDSMQIIFGQEISYPTQFNDYRNLRSDVDIMDYIMWVILLPLPGFLKFGYGDPQINLKFTMLVSGLDPTMATFSICLPGMVGESLFVFGKYLFPLHAIIYAIIITILIKFLSKADAYKYLFFYVLTVFSYNICRGGTASAYSFAFKQFLIFLFFIYYLKRKNRRYINGH